ncbi:VOC family protein [Pseudalkalibacillus caeni]|uniref:VOC family protein n=1 Tax=Exobacillus caeni TaxID=2574798 RepID=A0A5R9F043_9BACL|nr:VOC family protein [Pseudalkalibacillus caeni]TLS36972.1 VOC family protein [Pseudalkalibacillus caeni]
MKQELLRIGTTYIPVTDLEKSTEWYNEKLGAEVNYKDNKKSILELANQSFFLVKAKAGQILNFTDIDGNEHFPFTFEVDGEDKLVKLHNELMEKGVRVGEIEDRGHQGRNFVFYDPDGNKFDVWSVLSKRFKDYFGL